MARRVPKPPLPTIDGVSPSCVALPSGSWTLLLDFLTERFPKVARDDWAARMQRGELFDEQGLPVSPSQPYRPQTRIYYYRMLAQEQPIPFEESVLYQDDYLVVADKPHFLPVTPSGRYVQETLLVRLKKKLGIDTLTPIHRIDRETAGLVVFTVQPATRNAYQTLLRERTLAKTYEAIAPVREDLTLPLRYASRLEESEAFMQMRETGGEPNACTDIALLETSVGQGRYQLKPITGQKHQLRAHMAALGIPIANDRIYPSLLPEEAELSFERPLKLLARELAFTDPVTGQARYFKSGLQLDFF